MVAFREEHGLVQTNPSLTLNQDQLGQLNGRLVAARAETAEKKARLDLLKAIEEKGGRADSLNEMINSNAVGELRKQLADVSRREADLVARYGNGHPLVVNIRAERRDVERGVAAELQRLTGNIKNEYDLARAREQAIERSLEEVSGQTGADNRTAIRLRELERTAAVNKSLVRGLPAAGADY